MTPFQLLNNGGQQNDYFCGNEAVQEVGNFMSTTLWVIGIWIGLSVVGAILAALFMRGGESGGNHHGPALDPMSTRRRRRRQDKNEQKKD